MIVISSVALLIKLTLGAVSAAEVVKLVASADCRNDSSFNDCWPTINIPCSDVIIYSHLVNCLSRFISSLTCIASLKCVLIKFESGFHRMIQFHFIRASCVISKLYSVILN